MLKTREGKALCSENRWEYQDILKNFRDDGKFSYWFPDDYGFPNIDGIAKMKDEDGNCVIAYIQVTDAKKHAISLEHIIDMNNIFKSAASRPPIYIAVLPDPEALNAFHLEKNNVVFATIKVNVKYLLDALKFMSSAIKLLAQLQIHD